MKLAILLLAIASTLLAQPVVTVGVKIGAAAIQSTTLPPNLVLALQAFIATQTKPDPNDATKTVPKYADITDLVIQHLKAGLFRDVQTLTPAPAIAAKKVIADAAVADYEATKLAALP